VLALVVAARGQGQCASRAADTEESDTQRLGVVGALWPVLSYENPMVLLDLCHS